MVHPCVVIALLPAFTLPAILCGQPSNAMQAQRYQAAERIILSRGGPGLVNDDSAAVVDAFATVWSAVTVETIRVLADNPSATVTDIEAALCKLPESGACDDQSFAQAQTLALQPRLFVVAYSVGEVGTVFVAGFRDGQPAVLWSINTGRPEECDPHGLLSAWRADRSGRACWAKKPDGARVNCGPLYAALGLLPPDAVGRPRFYIDAGYAQAAGGTIGKQTSVWRWDGDTARLVWIDRHAFMVDQAVGTAFANSILSIGEKDRFRTFFACGSCEERQLIRRLKITPAGVDDLGKVLLTPELDLVDELFWRLAKQRPTADIASPQVAEFLAPRIAEAVKSSKEIDPEWFTTGMLMDFSVVRSGNTARVCFVVDGAIASVEFSIETAPHGEPKYVNAIRPTSYAECPKPASTVSGH